MKWFETWFDSKYYHILYKNRNTKEAELFLDNLIGYLEPKKTSTFLDLACGKGRHSIYLNSKGYKVLGTDLSKSSIESANKHKKTNLNFMNHDMRLPINGGKFDYILNLFTSFGYFASKNENKLVISSIYKNIKENGTIIIDFLNAKKVISNLVKQEKKHIKDLLFNISRTIEKNVIIKNIEVFSQKKKFNFQERVHALTLSDFEILLNKENLRIVDLFGDYHLNEFNAATSDRLILIAKK